MTRHRLEVWGDPIEHSRSPALHAAAYHALGLDWQYGRRQVSAERFSGELSALDATWRGLSLTMPLKEAAFAASSSRDRHAELTGAVNTMLLGPESQGFNTDVGGILDALAENAIAEFAAVRILGAGATAASALVAASECGASRVEVRARRPERAEGLRALGERLGVRVEVTGLDTTGPAVDLTIATLPSGTVLDASVSAALAESGGDLFEVAYEPWPSALADAWHGGRVVSGSEMLLHQALRQVRVFLHGDPLRPLDDEARVRDEMRSAYVGD
ncbi:shikimate dehydrogenase [Microbacterium sp.]|uniref:shikimate dehydrogenase n=1 Tax=Microbacterium sp. TaxID=51671 RepID=UPI003A8D7295